MRGETLINDSKDPRGREIDVESFYIRYGPMVLRRCRRMLKNEQSAFDAAQEVFLKILSNRNRLSGAYPSALLYRVATNVCLNRIRNERKHALNGYLDILHNTAFFESPQEDRSAHKLLEYILGKERESSKKIAVMYFVDGMTIKEIAETMNLSISGIHKRLDKLRRKIQNKGEMA